MIMWCFVSRGTANQFSAEFSVSHPDFAPVENGMSVEQLAICRAETDERGDSDGSS
jgi:hypothetical protein